MNKWKRIIDNKQEEWPKRRRASIAKNGHLGIETD